MISIFCRNVFIVGLMFAVVACDNSGNYSNCITAKAGFPSSIEYIKEVEYSGKAIKVSDIATCPVAVCGVKATVCDQNNVTINVDFDEIQIVRDADENYTTTVVVKVYCVTLARSRRNVEDVKPEESQNKNPANKDTDAVEVKQEKKQHIRKNKKVVKKVKKDKRNKKDSQVNQVTSKTNDKVIENDEVSNVKNTNAQKNVSKIAKNKSKMDQHVNKAAVEIIKNSERNVASSYKSYDKTENDSETAKRFVTNDKLDDEQISQNNKEKINKKPKTPKNLSHFSKDEESSQVKVDNFEPETLTQLNKADQKQVVYENGLENVKRSPSKTKQYKSYDETNVENDQNADIEQNNAVVLLNHPKKAAKKAKKYRRSVDNEEIKLVESENVGNDESEGNPLRLGSYKQFSNKDFQKAAEVQNNKRRAQHVVVKAHHEVYKAQERALRAENKVQRHQNHVERVLLNPHKGIRHFDRAQMRLERAQKLVPKAYRNVGKAQKGIGKAEKGLVKAEKL